MAHELSIVNGTAQMAYAGKTPWHGLGQSLPADASIPEWLKASGMDTEFLSAPVQFHDGRDLLIDPDHKVLYRADNRAIMGVVGTDYKIVQPRETVEFFSDLTGAAGFTLETMGLLFGGKRFWTLARIGSEASIDLGGTDRMKRYMLLASSADGSLATTGRYLDVRVVCNNTLRAGMASSEATAKVNHRSVFDACSAKKTLGIQRAHDQFAESMAQLRRMAETRIDPVKAIMTTAELFSPDFAKMDAAAQIKHIEKPSSPSRRIGELFLNKQAMGANLDGSQGTAWGWLNAVTEYIDHESRSRTADRRLKSAWFGPGATLKEKAREIAMEMVNADGSTRTVFQTVAVAEPVSAPVIEQHGSIDLAEILAASPELV